MPANVQVRVRLDKRALDEQLRGRTGAVGRTLASFAGIATREIKSEFKDRAGGVWWPVESTLAETPSRGVQVTTRIRASRPHRIVAKNAPALVFNLSDGTLFWGHSVNHPGSSPPIPLVLAGVEKAGRKLTFTRAAPNVSTFK